MGYLNRYFIQESEVKIFLIITAYIVLSACTSEDVKRNTYKALIQKQCIEDTGEPNCDSGQPDYDEYQRQREELKK